MPILLPLAEVVPFEEVAAILDDAAIRASGGGPPRAICAAGWRLANALDAAGFRVVRAPVATAQLTL